MFATLILMVFALIGLFVTSFTILSILICLAYGIPTTRRLERANMLLKDHPIIKRYWISIIILLFIYILALTLTYIFGSVDALGGYLGGSVIALLLGIKRIGKNINNLTDYVETQSRYFSEPIENAIEYLTKQSL